MFHSPLLRSLLSHVRVPKSKVELISFLLVSFVFILLSNCATIYKVPPLKPLSDQDVETILFGIQEQGNKVFSFYNYGALSIKDWNWESESHVLIVGSKNPFKLKIEVTHPWGRPIVHILIDEMRLKVLSFTDKKFYLGAVTPKALSKFLPGTFDAQLIWAALRGYPNLLKYHRSITLESNQIRLFDEKEKVVEIIDVYPDSLLPKLVFFPGLGITLAFSDFQENNGIYYARKVRVVDMKGKRNLVLKNRKMVFNKSIPEQIFQLEKPPSFSVTYLD